MLEDYWKDLQQWAAKPYDENGDIVSWFLFLGFMVAATFLWTSVIKRILN